MKEVDQNKITLEFECEDCGQKQRDLMINVIEHGAPLCNNIRCAGECPSETVLNRVFIKD
jgi:hypothetical protein